MIFFKNKKIKTNLPYLFIGILFEWIQVASYSPFKHGWILRDDAQPRPQIVQPNRRYLDAVYHNLTSRRVDDPEKRLNESRFSAPCSSNNAGLHSSEESARETPQHKWQMRGISHLKVLSNQD